MYLEVLEWEPPSSAGRPLVVLGGVALPAAVAAPALLPPPAPAGNGEPLAHPADPLPLVAGANTPRGAFFEVRQACPRLLQQHYCLPFKGRNRAAVLWVCHTPSHAADALRYPITHERRTARRYTYSARVFRLPGITGMLAWARHLLAALQDLGSAPTEAGNLLRRRTCGRRCGRWPSRRGCSGSCSCSPSRCSWSRPRQAR